MIALIPFRAAVREDIPAVLAFWRACAEPSSTDNAGALSALLEHDPGALILAESSDAIVGSVIAGWDGWRGTVYRLAVAPSRRRGGLGRQLVREAERRLEERGATRLQAIVVATDPRALAFWRSTAWEQHVEQARFTTG